MAIGAEHLRRGRHRPGAVMLAVAIDAGAAVGLVERPCPAGEYPPAQPERRAGRRQPRRRRVVMHVLVAGNARRIAHRDEGLDVASLAIALAPVLRRTERPRR